MRVCVAGIRRDERGNKGEKNVWAVRRESAKVERELSLWCVARQCSATVKKRMYRESFRFRGDVRRAGALTAVVERKCCVRYAGRDLSWGSCARQFSLNGVETHKLLRGLVNLGTREPGPRSGCTKLHDYAGWLGVRPTRGCGQRGWV
jgi:hypothetical protein